METHSLKLQGLACFILYIGRWHFAAYPYCGSSLVACSSLVFSLSNVKSSSGCRVFWQSWLPSVCQHQVRNTSRTSAHALKYHARASAPLTCRQGKGSNGHRKRGFLYAAGNFARHCVPLRTGTAGRSLIPPHDVMSCPEVCCRRLLPPRAPPLFETLEVNNLLYQLLWQSGNYNGEKRTGESRRVSETGRQAGFWQVSDSYCRTPSSFTKELCNRAVT